MATDRFTDQMQAYGRWKTDVTKAIAKYQQWLESHKMATPEVELRIFELVDALKSDRLTIAFVAEFARGKTELINAIFFLNMIAACYLQKPVAPPCARLN